MTAGGGSPARNAIARHLHHAAYNAGCPKDVKLVYVCICNALTDRKLQEAIADGSRRPAEVYAACGCRAQCGNCVRAILTLLRDNAAIVEAASA